MIRNIVKVIVLWLTVSHSFAQIDSYIGGYTGDNKNGFLQPVATVLTGAFNVGQVQHPAIDSSFHVYFHLVGTASFIQGNKLKYFSAETTGQFEPKQTALVPTLFGPRTTTTVSGINGTAFNFPAGMGVQILSLAVPQLTLAYAGTELTGRFFAYDTKDDIGKINLLGFGLRHDIGRYFMKNSPWKLSIGGMYQQVKAGTYLQLDTYSGGLTIGSQRKHFSYFAQAGYQAGKLEGNYKHYTGESFEQIDIDLTSDNPIYIGIGAGLHLGVLQLQLQFTGYQPIIGSFALGFKF